MSFLSSALAQNPFFTFQLGYFGFIYPIPDRSCFFLSTAVTETLLRLSNVLLISVLLIQVSSYAQISGLQDGIWFAVL